MFSVSQGMILLLEMQLPPNVVFSEHSPADDYGLSCLERLNQQIKVPASFLLCSGIPDGVQWIRSTRRILAQSGSDLHAYLQIYKSTFCS